MTTTAIDRAEVFSRPAARFDDDEQPGGEGLGGPELPPRPLVRRDQLRQPTNPPSEGVADGDGGGQRPRAGGGAGDGAGWLAGRSPPIPRTRRRWR